jgi:hypothetical protein
VVTLVSTFVAESLLIGIGEPAMPWEKVASIMNLVALFSRCTDTTERRTHRKGLLDMRCDKIIIAVLASRTLGLGSLWRKFGYALHCSDVVTLLRGRKGSPAFVSPCTLCVDEGVAPFSPDHNVQWIALLPLISFLSSLVDLLVETGDTSI